MSRPMSNRERLRVAIALIAEVAGDGAVELTPAYHLAEAEKHLGDALQYQVSQAEVDHEPQYIAGVFG